MPYKANQPRRHKIPKARYKLASWAEYNTTRRFSGTAVLRLQVTPEALAAWTPAQTWLAEPAPDYPGIAIETGMMLRLAFGRPWRQACWA